MTAPKPIDLSPIYSANIRAIADLEPEELMTHLAGSDLKVDPESGNVIADDKAKEAKDLFKQYAMVRVLIQAGGKDQKLDAKEAQALMKDLGLSGASVADFMKQTDTLIHSRWGVISKNLQRWSARRPFDNMHNFLDVYNQGLYSEETRLAKRSFSPGKFITNIGSLKYLVAPRKSLKVVDMDLAQQGEFKFTDVDATSFMGDNYAIDQATDDFVERAKAVAAFKQFYETAMKSDDPNHWSWRAMPTKDGVAKISAEEVLAQFKTAGNFEVTLGDEKYQITGEEAAEILEDQFPFAKLFDLATTKDLNQRYEKILKFAEEERPGFMGFGGGNAGNSDWMYNVTGVVNNLHFARSSLGFLTRRGGEEFRNRANDILLDMKGDGGGFGQWTYAGVANAICLGGLACKGPEFRKWSDEAAIDGPDKFGRDAVMLVGGYAGLRAWKEYNIAPLRRLGIWARANHRVMKGTKAVDEASGLAKVRFGFKSEKYYSFKPTKFLKPIVPALAYTFRGTKWLRNKTTGRIARFLIGGIERPTQLKLANMGSRSGDFLMASLATYLADKYIVPENTDNLAYDRNIDMRPLPIQDPAQIDFSEDPLLQDYSGNK